VIEGIADELRIGRNELRERQRAFSIAATLQPRVSPPRKRRLSNGLPFAHNKSHGSRRYRAVRGDIADPCEHSGGGSEGQHRKQCRRSPQTTERQRCVRKAQRTASFQHTLPSPPRWLPVRTGEAITTRVLAEQPVDRVRAANSGCLAVGSHLARPVHFFGAYPCHTYSSARGKVCAFTPRSQCTAFFAKTNW
jgi:hypothetical protein